MSRKQGLRERIKHECDGTTFTQRSRYVPDDEMWFIRRLSFYVINQNSAEINVYIENAGSDHVIYDEDNLVKARFTCIECVFWLFPGERLKVDWESVNSSSILEVCVTGGRIPIGR